GLHSVADGVRAKGWANGAFFEIFDGSRKRTGAERQCQVVSGFLAEVAGNLAAIINSALYGGSGSYAVIQNNGHLAANVLLSEGSKALGGLRREREIHLPHARIRGVAIFHGAAQIAAGDDWGAAQDVPAFGGVKSPRGVARLGAPGDEFCARR